jgi:hypothetical protein
MNTEERKLIASILAEPSQIDTLHGRFDPVKEIWVDDAGGPFAGITGRMVVSGGSNTAPICADTLGGTDKVCGPADFTSNYDYVPD